MKTISGWLILWGLVLLSGVGYRALSKKTSISSIEVWLDLIEGIEGATDSHSELSASAISQLKQYPLYKMLHNSSGATVTFNGQQLQFSARQIRCVCVCVFVSINT